MRGFCQHVLPRSLQKVRYYGWLGANCKTSFDEARWLVWLFLGWVYWLASGYAPQPESEPRPAPTCGGAMHRAYVVHHRLPRRRSSESVRLPHHPPRIIRRLSYFAAQSPALPRSSR